MTQIQITNNSTKPESILIYSITNEQMKKEEKEEKQSLRAPFRLGA